MKENNVFENELRVYRKEIDKVDNKLIKLLNERGRIVQKIGKIKKQVNLDIYQPEREKKIIERIKSKSKILKNTSVENIWREIINACKVIQDLYFLVN